MLGSDGIFEVARRDGPGHGRGLVQGAGDAPSDVPTQPEDQKDQDGAGDRHDAGEDQRLLLHVAHVHARCDHPAPWRVGGHVAFLGDGFVRTGFGPGEADETAALAGLRDLFLIDLHPIRAADVGHVLADKILALRMHQHGRRHVVDEEVVHAAVGVGSRQGGQRLCLGVGFADPAGPGQFGVMGDDRLGHVHFAAQRVFAGLVQIQVLHPRGHHGQADDTECDQHDQHAEFAADREIVEALQQSGHRRSLVTC